MNSFNFNFLLSLIKIFYAIFLKFKKYKKKNYGNAKLL